MDCKSLRTPSRAKQTCRQGFNQESLSRHFNHQGPAELPWLHQYVRLRQLISVDELTETAGESKESIGEIKCQSTGNENKTGRRQYIWKEPDTGDPPGVEALQQEALLSTTCIIES